MTRALLPMMYQINEIANGISWSWHNLFEYAVQKAFLLIALYSNHHRLDFRAFPTRFFRRYQFFRNAIARPSYMLSALRGRSEDAHRRPAVPMLE